MWLGARICFVNSFGNNKLFHPSCQSNNRPNATTHIFTITLHPCWSYPRNNNENEIKNICIAPQHQHQTGLPLCQIQLCIDIAHFYLYLYGISLSIYSLLTVLQFLHVFNTNPPAAAADSCTRSQWVRSLSMWSSGERPVQYTLTHYLTNSCLGAF